MRTAAAIALSLALLVLAVTAVVGLAPRDAEPELRHGTPVEWPAKGTTPTIDRSADRGIWGRP